MPRYGILINNVLQNAIVADDEANALEATGGDSCVVLIPDMTYAIGWLWNGNENKFIQPQVTEGVE